MRSSFRVYSWTLQRCASLLMSCRAVVYVIFRVGQHHGTFPSSIPSLSRRQCRAFWRINCIFSSQVSSITFYLFVNLLQNVFRITNPHFSLFAQSDTIIKALSRSQQSRAPCLQSSRTLSCSLHGRCGQPFVTSSTTCVNDLTSASRRRSIGE